MDGRADIFSTDCVAKPRRLAFWNEVAATTFGDIAIDSRSCEFSARLRRLRLGALTLTSVTSSPARVEGARSGRAAADGWFLLLNEHGSARMSQRSREVLLQPGELTALRADEPYRIEFSRPNQTIVLYMPGDARDINLDGHLVRRHGTQDTPLFMALMRQLEVIDPAASVTLPSFERLAIDVAALCWPAPARLPARRFAKQPMAAWERQVHQHIEQNLSDPGLSAASIARHYHVSARFIHMVFVRTGQTAAACILERRLTAAAASLRSDPTARILDVALDTGFSDLSYFCRAFRRRFGVSAREYRKRPRS